MRKARRLAAIAAAAMMTAALALPMSMSSFAAGDDPTYSITVTNNGNVNVANHTLGAYQIFAFSIENGTISGAVNWGASATEAVRAALRTATNVDENADAEAVMNAMKDLESDSTQVDAIAKVIGNALTDSDEPVKTSTNGVLDVTTTGSGYYFVKDTEAIGAGDAATKFMLQVLGEERVAIKTDAPTLVKKIWHNDTDAEPEIGTAAPDYSTGADDVALKDIKNAGWNDVGDNQIGDTVYYMTASSVPDMSAYDTYVYEIHDKMCDGLTFTGIESIVYVPDGATDGSEIDESGYNLLTGTNAGGDTFVVAFDDLKTVVDGKGTIYTYYTAVLNENALISTAGNNSQGNENKAQLVYSNNPNASGNGTNEEEERNEKGSTEWDFVYDWTFVSNGNKVDENEAPLANAVFELHDADDNALNLVKVETPNLESGAQETGRDYYRLAKKDETENVITQITTNADGKFAFVGLDDTVTYTLQEVSAPTGYNTAGDADLVLTASYNKETGATVLTSLSLAMETEDGEKVTSAGTTVTIQNMKKTFTLPSTGGIGTTLFYVVGGVLVAGAGVTLITKKRLGDSEK